MTDDISNYTFDFEKEVNDLRRSLGSKAGNILFTEVDVTPSKEANVPPEISLQKIVGAENFNKATFSFIHDWIVSSYTDDPLSSSFSNSFSNADNIIVGHVVCLREKESLSKELGEENKNLMRLFILYHETAHVLIPGVGNGDQDHPFWEAAGDAYAALRLFQRFGQEAGALLSMMSWLRTKDAIVFNTHHLTTTVLDKIIADSARRDFSELTPAETAELAESYAKEWTPTASVLSAARPLFRQGNCISPLLLAQTCLTSSDKFAFYIGAKFFQPFLQPEGILWNGKTSQLTAIEREAYARFIEKTAAGMGLHAIFNRVADRPEEEPPVTTLLKISLPAGQKQFVVDPPKFP